MRVVTDVDKLCERLSRSMMAKWNVGGKREGASNKDAENLISLGGFESE